MDGSYGSGHLVHSPESASPVLSSLWLNCWLKNNVWLNPCSSYEARLNCTLDYNMRLNYPLNAFFVMARVPWTIIANVGDLPGGRCHFPAWWRGWRGSHRRAHTCWSPRLGSPPGGSTWWCTAPSGTPASAVCGGAASPPHSRTRRPRGKKWHGKVGAYAKVRVASTIVSVALALEPVMDENRPN